MVMRIIDKMRKQTAVVWQNAIPDSLGGYDYDQPREIRVRWSKKSEWYQDENGDDKISNAVVYIGLDVVVGEYLYLGSLSYLTQEQKDDPKKIGYRIMKSEKIPTFDATQFLRKAIL